MSQQSPWDTPEMNRLFAAAADRGILPEPDQPEHAGAAFSVLFVPETDHDVLHPLPQLVARLKNYTTEFSTMTPHQQRRASHKGSVWKVKWTIR